MCAELAGDFHLGDSRQLTDKSLLPFDLVEGVQKSVSG
jgi:hypothetical protein